VANVQLDLVSRHGTARRVGVSATAQTDGNGKFLRSMSVMYDLSAVEAAEQQRLKLAAVEAENRALTVFDKAKSQFLATMSHELRTPLIGVLGFATLMQSQSIAPDSPKYSRYLSQISASGRQLLSMIEALLDAARLQAGTLTVTPVAVDLVDLVVDCVASYQPAAHGKAIELNSRVDVVGTVCIDPIRFRQVLGALLSNAIKFSQEGGDVLVSVEPEGDDGMRVSVEDHGPGITHADLSRLFQPFSQLDSGPSRSHEGAGLGLSLVKQLVESQGGSVGVGSSPGVGSVFYFVLPVIASTGETPGNA
jgi:signal transduction histidine kinase